MNGPINVSGNVRILEQSQRPLLARLGPDCAIAPPCHSVSYDFGRAGEPSDLDRTWSLRIDDELGQDIKRATRPIDLVHHLDIRRP